jgi:hypothetical protein
VTSPRANLRGNQNIAFVMLVQQHVAGRGNAGIDEVWQWGVVD